LKTKPQRRNDPAGQPVSDGYRDLTVTRRRTCALPQPARRVHLRASVRGETRSSGCPISCARGLRPGGAAVERGAYVPGRAVSASLIVMNGERVLRAAHDRDRIASGRRGVAAALDYVVPGAEQGLPLSARVAFRVGGRPDGVRARARAGAPAACGGRPSASRAAGRAVRANAPRGARAVRRCGPRPRGEPGAAGAARFLAVVPRDREKTSLALRLLFDGCRCSGTSSVLLRDGRRWRFRGSSTSSAGDDRADSGTRENLGETAQVRDSHEPRSGPSSRRDAGLPWRIEPAPLRVVLVLEPGFESPSAGSSRFPRFRTVERIHEPATVPGRPEG